MFTPACPLLSTLCEGFTACRCRSPLPATLSVANHPRPRGPAHLHKLVIVESPAKAKTISRFLGPGYRVEASLGHVRDLPAGRKDLPEEYRGFKWADFAVNIDDQFQPIYVVPDEKKKHIANLKAALKGADELLLATDEDREGESISWHLSEVLAPKVPVRRIVFHEITREAIEEAIAHPARHRSGSRPCARSSPRPRPSFRLHLVARPVAAHPTRPQRRTRPIGRRPASRRTRGGARCVPQFRLLGP